ERIKLKNSNDWEAVRLMLDLTISREGKRVDYKASEVFFTAGDKIAPDLFDAKTGESLKKTLIPTIPASRYSADHLVAGRHHAKYKILVFSDPYCPFCKEFLHDALELANRYPDKVALYYYHFPLTALHPAAPTTIRAMIAAELRGLSNVTQRIYKADLDSKKSNDDEILKSVNSVLGINLSKTDLYKPAVEKRLKNDLDFAYAMMIRGTPAVFINSQADPKREKFEAIVKELKK
ncbi:MAG: DsbA family protein, partial [Campylobacterales bacterium]